MHLLLQTPPGPGLFPGLDHASTSGVDLCGRLWEPPGLFPGQRVPHGVFLPHARHEALCPPLFTWGSSNMAQTPPGRTGTVPRTTSDHGSFGKAGTSAACSVWPTVPIPTPRARRLHRPTAPQGSPFFFLPPSVLVRVPPRYVSSLWLGVRAIRGIAPSAFAHSL